MVGCSEPVIKTISLSVWLVVITRKKSHIRIQFKKAGKEGKIILMILM